MPGLIINMSVSDTEDSVDAHDLGKYIASIVRSALGEDIRVNVSTVDTPHNRIDIYKTIRDTSRKPWSCYGN